MAAVSWRVAMSVTRSSSKLAWGLCLVLAGAALVAGQTAGQASSDSGKMYPPMLTADVPNPVAFFPLSEGFGTTVNSFPDATYNGTLQGPIPWVNDEVFGSVLDCNRENQDLIVLDPVDYASMGPFTVNLWEKANSTDQDGELFEYVYSHSAYAGRQNFAPVDAFHPNQIQIYLPENQHPAAGLVRTVVKDSTDLDTTAFLDSDGHYNDNSARTRINGNPANDGAWHMITLTTHADGSAGYLVFVDGLLAASLPGTGPNALNATTANPELLLDGGRPIFLENGTIYLCGRSDGDPSRYFSGSVSHVGMWNTVLTPAQILNLYKTVVVSTASTFSSIPGSPAGAPGGAPLPGAAAPAIQAVQTFAAPQASVTQQPPATGPVAAISAAVSPVSAPQQMTIAGRPCQFPFFYRGIPRTACVPYSDEDSATFCLDVDGRYAMCSPQPLSAYSTPQSWLDQWANKGALQTSIGMNGMQEVVTCNSTTTAISLPSTCAGGYVCAPLPNADIRAANNAAESAASWGLTPPANPLPGAMMGVCASPDGVALPVGPTVPVPTAYFPLTNGSTYSWPIPEYWAYNTSAVASKQTKFVKDSYFGTVVECNATAGSSLAIEGVQWGRQGPFAMNIWIKQLRNDDDMFAYVLSVRNRTLTNVTDDSIFYPNQVHVYLPGKNHPAHDTVRAIVKDDTDTFTGDSSRVWVDSDGTIGSNSERNTVRESLLGGWHMITISTMPDGQTGFQLYIDGLPHTTLSSPQEFFQVDGGRSIYADGPITLCDRADRVPGRGFDGRLAQLAIYDAALSDSNIALLYEAVTGQTPDLSSTPAPALPPVASPQAAAGAGPAAGPGQPAAAPAAAPKPTLSSAASSPASSAGDNNPDDNISVTDLTGDESSALSQATAPAVPNPAIRQPVDVRSTAAAAGRVSVNGASAAPGGGKLAPGAIAGIAVGGVALLALVAGIAALVVRKRRPGGRWRKAQLEGGARPGGGGGPGGAGNAVQTSFPATQAMPKRPGPELDTVKLFTGPPSNTFSMEASSAL